MIDAVMITVDKDGIVSNRNVVVASTIAVGHKFHFGSVSNPGPKYEVKSFAYYNGLPYITLSEVEA